MGRLLVAGAEQFPEDPATRGRGIPQPSPSQVQVRSREDPRSVGPMGGRQRTRFKFILGTLQRGTRGRRGRERTDSTGISFRQQ